MKPPELYPKVDHFIVHPNNYDQWERLCEALARHCREEQFNVAGWEVCNEPDIGEMGGTPHYFKEAADYNQLYTHTRADASKFRELINPAIIALYKGDMCINSSGCKSIRD
jgi:hypothetical protein